MSGKRIILQQEKANDGSVNNKDNEHVRSTSEDMVTAATPEYSASFEGLVDLVVDDQDRVAFLVKEDNGFAVKQR